ncbi:transposase [Polynucleobacter sp. 31A-FELB]|uniref:integrase core domain-containing protein n=1 Tax=Polynucleobacter sp. 31A-FELB TaxID=2689096 RepID=UPI001C0B2A42|nr:integrase core domain-containing protein [Polynucleobacter sp. 31A-FELB]MBU3588090.1 transposase [Polynucleobacter sp. 31A-FELB]
MLWAKLLKHLNTSVNDSLIIQNELLKAQIHELRRQLPNKKRLVFSQFCKQQMARLGKQLSPEGLRDSCLIVRPSTVLRWYRGLIAEKFDGSKNRTYPGRPRIKPENENLILEIASKNPNWGAKRIEGALAHVGIDISHQTILNVLERNGFHPSPDRSGSNSWARFIEVNRSAIVATDFLSWEVLTLRGLTSYFILFFIRLDTRQVEIAGISNHPNEQWMTQIARNITMTDIPFYSGMKYLIHDRDTKYCTSFCRTLRYAGIKPIKLPILSPNPNAYAERWIRSIKSECLNHFIFLSKRSLERAVTQYVEHYNLERTHQGIGNVVLNASATPENIDSSLMHRQRLGGLLSYYYRSDK